MSERPDIEAIEARLAAATPGPWRYDGRISIQGNGTGVYPPGGGIDTICWMQGSNCPNWFNDAEFIAHAPADIAALLAEVERLQRERAEWRDRADALMTEQMTQMRDLTAEVEALRARLALTPERVEAAAKAQYEFDNPGGPEFKDCVFRCLYLDATRAALLAAGFTEEQRC